MKKALIIAAITAFLGAITVHAGGGGATDPTDITQSTPWKNGVKYMKIKNDTPFTIAIDYNETQGGIRTSTQVISINPNSEKTVRPPNAESDSRIGGEKNGTNNWPLAVRVFKAGEDPVIKIDKPQGAGIMKDIDYAYELKGGGDSAYSYLMFWSTNTGPVVTEAGPSLDDFNFDAFN